MSITAQMLINSIREVQKKDEKLVLIVGQPGSGKSKLMRFFADVRGWKYLDAEQLVTPELLELVPRVRAREAPVIMGKILAASVSEVYLIDGVQTLFTPLLQLDPLSLLRHLSRKYTMWLLGRELLKTGVCILNITAALLTESSNMRRTSLPLYNCKNE